MVASIEVFPPWNKKSAVLQKAITSRQSNAATDPQSADPATAAKAPKDQEPIDWKKVAGQFAEMRSRGGMTDMQSMMKLQRRLQAMSKDEIGAAFETPAEAREMLEQMLISQLAEKDPEFTLKKFVDRLQERDGSMSWSLANAMQAWARKDPARAIAWFDQQIAAGKFDSKALDGKSQPRLNFEGSLINLLLDSDPSAAGSRLAALPQDQRHEALQSGFNHPLTAENEAAFAKLVRDHIPAEEQARTLAEKTSSLVRGDQSYKRVTEFLDRIQAPPPTAPNAPNAPNAPPRTACVEQVAESELQHISFQKKITRENINKMREWVSSEAPESVGSITGTALANASQNGRKMEFSEAAELALEYHNAAGNDAVLSAFLESWPARKNKEQARTLAEKIADPDHLVASTLAKLTREDPFAAIEWLNKNESRFPCATTDNVKNGLIAGVAASDTKLAFKLNGELGIKETWQAVNSIIRAAKIPAGQTATLIALREHLAGIPDEKARKEFAERAINRFADTIAEAGFEAGTKWIAESKLTPTELEIMARSLQGSVRSAESGRWIEWIGEKLPTNEAGGAINRLVRD